MIANRMSKLDASGIRKVFDLAAKMKNPVNLSIGQPDFNVPIELKNAACEAMQGDCNSYTQTQGIAPLLDLIGNNIKKRYGRESEDILITSGVSGGISLVFNVLLNIGDEVIIADPYFVMYKHITNLLGAKPVYLDTYPDFSYDPEKIERLITPKTKALVLNSPCNPTGKIISQSEIDALVEVAKRNNIYIISDEIYDYFNYLDGMDVGVPSAFGKYEKTILLNGFSKSHGLTGWRVGYAAGTAEVIGEMKKLQQYTFVCAPAPFQNALLKGYDSEVMRFIKERVSEYKQKRDIVYQGLKDKFNLSPSDGAFYAFVEAPGQSATEFVKRAIEKNLLIIPGSVFSEKDSHFRISFAANDDTLKKGIDILNSLV